MNNSPPPRDLAGQIWIAIGVLNIFLAALIAPVAGWIFAEQDVLFNEHASFWPSVLVTLVGFMLLSSYGTGFANRPQRVGRYRAVLYSWSLAAGLLLLTLPLRFVLPLQFADLTLFVQMIQLIGLLLFLGMLAAVGERQNAPAYESKSAGWLPWLLAPLMMAGWLQNGAWGSVLETFFNLLLGLLFGVAVSILIGRFLLPAIEADSRGPGWDMWLSGWAVSGSLVIMGSALAIEANLLLLPLLLSFVGWLGVAVMRIGSAHGRRPAVLGRLAGLVTGIALISADVDELSVYFMLETFETIPQLIPALGLSLLVALAVAIMLWLVRQQIDTWRPERIVRVLTVIMWIAIGVLLFQKSNRGFHGDQLFVIMSSQANLDAAPDMPDVQMRRAFVYETLVAHADATQADVRSALDFLNVEYQPYYLVNGVAVRGGFLMRLWLSSFASVDRVVADPVLRPLPMELTTLVPLAEDGRIENPPETLPWGIRAIGADRVWDAFGVRGAGVVVGQSDSGVQWDHLELIDSYRGGENNHDYNWLDPWADEPTPYDVSGHGTHTLGSVLGNHVGVAPDAEWFGCANLVRGIGSPSLYLDCMQFMLAPYPNNGDPLHDGDPTLAADVLNNSWGCPSFEGCDATTLQAGVEALRAAGIFVVVSAGNSGDGGCETVSSPLALYDASFSVGAYAESGELASFSSRGPVGADGSLRTKPDIIAPGVDVYSAMPTDRYESNQGTSMAGPHVAGVVALIWSANPDLRGNINATELILTETATPYNVARHGVPNCGLEVTPNNAVGYGVVNAYGAVKRALEWQAATVNSAE